MAAAAAREKSMEELAWKEFCVETGIPARQIEHSSTLTAAFES
jgi:hypothetical protein